MAEALARRKPGDKSAVGNLTQTQLYVFLEEYVEADNRVKEANSKRKELRDRIKVALVDADLIESFDWFRKNRDVSGEYRAKQEAAKAVMMAWDRKPLGYSGGLGLGPNGERLPLTQADAAKIDFEGLAAGRSNANRTDNPYNPGEEEFQRWDTAWLRGQGKMGSDLTDDPEKKAATLAVVEGGKSTATAPAAPAAEGTPRRRGRPPGTGKKRDADAATAGQRTPDQGEGGDLGDRAEPQPQGDGAEQSGQSQDDPGEDDPARTDPPVDAGEGEQQAATGPDKFGMDWPSRAGNGNTSH